MSNNIDKSIVDLLSKFQPGFLPEELFQAIARLIVTPTVVLIPFRKRGESKEVLLIERDENDTTFAGYWHTPGTVLLSSDVDIEMAINRIVRREIGIRKLTLKPKFVDFVFTEISRGKEISLIYCVQLRRKPRHGRWFAINDLPSKLIPSDIPRIKKISSKCYMK